MPPARVIDDLARAHGVAFRVNRRAGPKELEKFEALIAPYSTHLAIDGLLEREDSDLERAFVTAYRRRLRPRLREASHAGFAAWSPPSA